MYSSEIEKLQHKLQIMSEMYQEKELKLHRWTIRFSHRPSQFQKKWLGYNYTSFHSFDWLILTNKITEFFYTLKNIQISSDGQISQVQNVEEN